MQFVMFGHNDWWVWARQGFCTRNAALARELAGRETVAADGRGWGESGESAGDRR